MTRNAVFSNVVVDLLQGRRRLRLQDMYPLVKGREPDWCVGDWQHGLQAALENLKRYGHIITEPSPERSNRLIYRLPDSPA